MWCIHFETRPNFSWNNFYLSIKFEFEYEFQDLNKNSAAPRIRTQNQKKIHTGKLRTVKWQWIQFQWWHWITSAFPSNCVHFCCSSPSQTFNVQWCTFWCVPFDKTFEKFLSQKIKHRYSQDKHFIQFLTNVEIHRPSLSLRWFVRSKCTNCCCVWHPSYALSLVCEFASQNGACALCAPS